MSPDTVKQLESLGEVAVARLLAQGEYGLDSSPLRLDVETWLRAKTLEASFRKEMRDEESLSISRKALLNSKLATIIATIAIIYAARVEISALIISWLP